MQINVVIPYYQYEPALLRRALNSVFNQSLPSDVTVNVVIVDDSSPCPVKQAVQSLDLPAGFSLQLLHQDNAGPAAARNAGLDVIDFSSDRYVAFLDSDDFWYPDHVVIALEKLNSSQFYFCNSMHDETDSFSYFPWVLEHHARLSLGKYLPQDGLLSGLDAFNAFVVDCIPHTSQVVFDFRANPMIRFDDQLRRAGEDHLFWLSLSANCEKVSYSTMVQGERGHGVSIYRESLSWNSPNGPDRLIDVLLFRERLLENFELSLPNRRLVSGYLQDTRDQLTFILLRHLLRRPKVVARAMRRLLRDYPVFFLHLPRALFRMREHMLKLRRKIVEERSKLPPVVRSS